MTQISVLIPHELLRELLHLPEDTKIQAIEQDGMDRAWARFRVLITNPIFTEVLEDRDILMTTLTLRRDYKGKVSLQNLEQR